MLFSLVIAAALAVVHGSESKALAVSPLVQQGPKLTVGEEGGKGDFGRDVALSVDGDTALVGAPHEDGEAGAVWVFTRSGSTWSPQAKLTGGEEEVGEGHFGHSVALSADGDTAAIGAPSDDNSLGAVWIFTRSGSTWTQQGSKLTGAAESNGGQFGAGVALSAEGDTAVIGAPTDDGSFGAAWVFARAGSTWEQQGEKLTGGEESGPGELGRGVALSADGDTALVGAPHDEDGVGAVWVFTRAGSTWSQQGAKLTGGEEVGDARFGRSVALSSDGNTALVGGRYDDGMIGAAWVFARAGSTWSQQGAKLTASGEIGTGELGYSVALAADGDTALIGGSRDRGYLGAAWVFARAGSTWEQQGEKLTGGEESGNGWFGSSVALSGEAGTALIGGLGDRGDAGAAWVFGVPLPPPPPPPPLESVNGETRPGSQTQPSAGSAPSASAPAAKQGVAGYRAVGGGVALLSRTIFVRNARASVKLRCIAPVACRGRLTLVVVVRAKAVGRSSGGRSTGERSSGGRSTGGRSTSITIATARFSIPSARTTTVKLTLLAAGRLRLSAGRGRLNARLAIHLTAPDPSRGQQTRAYAVKLVLRRAHRPARSPLPRTGP